jgi:hypothetical protein
MTTNLAQVGKYTLNPNKFIHADVEYVELSLGGVSFQRPYTPDFGNGIYAREYISFLEAANQAAGGGGCGITGKNFGDGTSVFAFDCRPDLLEDYGVYPIETGQISVDLRFRNQTPEPLTLFFFAEYYGSFELDFEHNVNIIGAPVL